MVLCGGAGVRFGSDKTRAVRLYGASGSSLEARMAVEKLQRAGYTDVAEVEGGLEAWLEAGLPNTCGAPLPPAPEVLAIQHDQANSHIFAQNKPVLPYLDNSAALLAQLQKTGEEKHRAEAENDEALAARAKSQARDSLEGLLKKIHPGREVHIEFRDKP